MKEGFTITTIPARHEKTCTGCKYLQVSAMLRGSKYNTNNYNCTHKDAPQILNIMKANIAYNSQEHPTPPDFCPFLKNTTNG